MTSYKHLSLWMLFGILLSCTKEAARPGAAALTIVNAVPDSDPSLLPIFGGTQPLTWYAFAAQIPYGVSFVTGSYSGTQALTIYHYPDTTEHSTPLFDLTLHLPVNTIHTLFLTGTMAAPDTLFTTDALPNFPSSDSSLGIRFVNLSYGSAPVSVNITGLAQGSEVNSLPYKGLTGFIHYPATSGVSDYTFEFRDAASGDLIGSCLLSGVNETFLNTRRYRNFTMAFTGVPNDPSTLKIILIEAYSSY